MKTKLTNRQLRREVASLQQQLLAEREARNLDARTYNGALDEVCRQRDQYRSQLHQAATDLTALRTDSFRKVTEAEDLAWWTIGALHTLSEHAKGKLTTKRATPKVPLSSFSSGARPFGSLSR